MSKYIVIEKERIEALKYELNMACYDEKLIKKLSKVWDAFFEIEESTELDTDESIEERAKKFYPPQTTDFICSPKLVRDGYIKGATEQDIIYKLKEKESNTNN